jgi:hypothetical protein
MREWVLHSPPRVANRLTAIPETPVPRAGALAAAVMPLADGFMRVMLSRPQTGSLRSTWVTPATLWLSLASGALAAALAIAFAAGAASDPSVLTVFAAGVCASFAAAALAVCVVGIDQRRQARLNPGRRRA